MAKEKWVYNYWFWLTVVFAFGSVISAFQINSYWADQNDFNGIIGWLGISIVCGLLAIFFLWKTSKTSTGTGG